MILVSSFQFVVPTSVLSTKSDMSYLEITQEEAAQIIILHAANTAHDVQLLKRQL